MKDLVPGQVWEYRHRQGEEGSSLVIGKIVHQPKVGAIVHVSVAGIKILLRPPASGWIDRIPHMPFALQALEQSLGTLVGAGIVPDEFDRGFQAWQEQQGGVFTISVERAIRLLDEARPARAVDSFHPG